MFTTIKKKWREFHHASPGRRFSAFHERRHHQGVKRHWWMRLLFWLAGIVCLLAGAFFAVFPGPAVIFFIPGAILIASESLGVARALDWIDVRLAPVVAALGRRWRSLSKSTQLGIKIITVCGSVAVMVAGLVVTKG